MFKKIILILCVFYFACMTKVFAAEAQFRINNIGTQFKLNGSTFIINGSVTLLGDTTIYANDSKIILSGNLNNSGTFTSSSESEIKFFNNAASSTISGNNIFEKFTCTNPGKKLNFAVGTTQTILSNFNLKGSESKPIKLRSTIEGGKWYINISNYDQTVFYVDVKDSDANMNKIYCISSKNSGNNNNNWVFGHVVISEICVDNNEFVELYNPTAYNVSLGGWYLKKKDSLGNESELVSGFSSSTTIKSKSYLLITPPEYGGAVTKDYNYTSAYRLEYNNTVLLYSDNGVSLVDKVGMGTCNDYETLPTVNPIGNNSVERKAKFTSTAASMGPGGEDEFLGNGYDSDRNNIDFYLRAIAEPQNSTFFEPLPNRIPNVPTNLSQDIVVNDWISWMTIPTFFFTQSDPDFYDDLKYNVQISTVSNFNINVLSYISKFLLQGATSYPIGAYTGDYNGGVYETGSPDCWPFNDGIYYWRVSSIDNAEDASDYSTFNSSNPAFKIDLTPPTVITTLSALWLSNESGAPGYSKMKLTWTKPTDSGSGLKNDYYIYRATFQIINLNGSNKADTGNFSAAGKTFYRIKISNPSPLIFYDTYANLGCRFYYVIQSIDNVGNFSIQSNNAVVVSASISVTDGSVSDWLGTMNNKENSATISENEWIWNDKNLDMRDDSDSSIENGNFDLREFRVKMDEENCYFMIRFTSMVKVGNAFPQNVCISLDIDQDENNNEITSMNWNGDQSGLSFGNDYLTSISTAATYAERQVNIHFKGTNSTDGVIEISTFTGSNNWRPPIGSGADACYFKEGLDENSNFIEVLVKKSDLGIIGSGIMRMKVAVYNNNAGYDNTIDSTKPTTSSPDALDTISIARISLSTSTYYNDPQNNMNTWEEELSDSDYDFFVDLRYSPNGELINTPPKPVMGPVDDSPSDNGSISDTGAKQPYLEWKTFKNYFDDNNSNPNVYSDIDGENDITGYLLEVSSAPSFENLPGNYRINISTTGIYKALTNNTVVWKMPYSLVANADYYWRVYARDKCGTLSNPNIWHFDTKGSTVPNKANLEVPDHISTSENILATSSGTTTGNPKRCYFEWYRNGFEYPQYVSCDTNPSLLWASILNSSNTFIDDKWYVRARWANDSNNYGKWSDISIVEIQASSLSVSGFNIIKPNGHIISPGIQYDIVWSPATIIGTSDEGEYIDYTVDYSTDSGFSWHNITYSTTKTTYTWTVPDYESNNYQIRIKPWLAPTRLSGGNAIDSSFTVSSAKLLISEVCVGTGTASTEYVEIYNASESSITINNSNFKFYTVDSGNSITNKNLSWVNNTIKPRGYFLIASVTQFFTIQGEIFADATYSPPELTSSSGAVLKDKAGIVLDKVGWGDNDGTPPAAPSNAVDGTPFSQAGGLSTGDSIERYAVGSRLDPRVGQPGEFKGNGYNTNNNAEDFIFEPDYVHPQNSNSSQEPVSEQNIVQIIHKPGLAGDWGIGMRIGKSPLTNSGLQNTIYPRRNDIVNFYVSISSGMYNLSNFDVSYQVINSTSSVFSESKWQLMEKNQFYSSSSSVVFWNKPTGYTHSIDAYGVRGSTIAYYFKIEQSGLPLTYLCSDMTDNFSINSCSTTLSNAVAISNPFKYYIRKSPPSGPQTAFFPEHGQTEIAPTNIMHFDWSDVSDEDGNPVVDYELQLIKGNTNYILPVGDIPWNGYIGYTSITTGNSISDKVVNFIFEGENIYFWRVRAKDASGYWGTWCNSNSYWAFVTAGARHVDLYNTLKHKSITSPDFSPVNYNNWQTLPNGGTISNDERVLITAAVYASDGYPGDNELLSHTSMYFYYTIDGTDPITPLEVSTGVVASYCFKGTFHHIGPYNGYDVGNHAFYTMEMQEDIHPADTTIKVQVYAKDKSGYWVNSSVVSYNVINKPDYIIQKPLKHNIYKTSQAPTRPDAYLTYSHFNSSSSFYYFMGKDRSMEDTFFLSNEHFIIKDPLGIAGSNPQNPDIFRGQTPYIILRTGHNDTGTNVPKICVSDDEGVNWTYTDMANVTNDISYNGRDDKDEGVPSGTDEFTADPNHPVYENNRALYRKFSYWGVNTTAFTNITEQSKTRYYFQITDGDYSVYLGRKTDVEPFCQTYATEIDAKNHAFDFETLQDDRSRPYCKYELIFDINYNNYINSPMNVRRGLGFVPGILGSNSIHVLSDPYIVSVDLFDKKEGMFSFNTQSEMFSNVYPGRGNDSGIYHNLDNSITGTTNNAVHDTRLYYIICGTPPAAFGVNYNVNIGTDYLKGTDTDDVSANSVLKGGDFIDNDAVLTNRYTHYTGTINISTDTVMNTGVFGYVQLNGDQNGGTWSNINDLIPLISNYANAYIYYRIYVCNNDFDPMAFAATSANSGISLNENATTPNTGDNWHRNEPGCDAGGKWIDPNSNNAKNSDRDHGWIMNTRFGGRLFPRKVIRITVRSTQNGITKTLVNRYSVIGNTVGPMISSEILKGSEERE